MCDTRRIEQIFLASTAVVIQEDFFIVVYVPSRDNDYFVAIVDAETCVGSLAVVGMAGG